MLAMHTSVFCYYQDLHEKPDRRSLSRRGYQVLLTVWSISWSKGYSIPLLTPVVPASFGPNFLARNFQHKIKKLFCTVSTILLNYNPAFSSALRASCPTYSHTSCLTCLLPALLSFLTCVPTKIIKQNADIFSECFFVNINHSINNSTFLEQLKLADVKPVFKKNSRIVKENCRPVSIVPNISKIYER